MGWLRKVVSSPEAEEARHKREAVRNEARTKAALAEDQVRDSALYRQMLVAEAQYERRLHARGRRG